MGLFNWVMPGLGFEDQTTTSDKPQKEKKSKHGRKDMQNQNEDKYSNFNLHEKIDSEQPSPSESVGGNKFAGFGFKERQNFIILSPRSHKDVQSAVDYLKDGQQVNLDLSNIAEDDSTRILDFLSGAIYGLNGSITRWSGDYFILTPEGHRILKKEE